ncbi:hypothetical protein C8R44DRAFT_891900 [Mycena epipterygia]|nr:hypothetical protein C8R44DRAFT_891900 [Mycena epipterygia]
MNSPTTFNVAHIDEEINPAAKAFCLFTLAEAFFQKAKSGCAVSDLDAAIELLDGHFSAQATALSSRFSFAGDIHDVVKALMLCLKGVYQTENTESGAADGLNAMGQATVILRSFHEKIDRSALEKAIHLHRKALSLRDSSNPDRWRSLCALSVVLLARFRITDNSVDLDESVSLQQQIQDDHPNRRGFLSATLVMKLHQSLDFELVSEVMKVTSAGMVADREAFDLRAIATGAWSTAKMRDDFTCLDQLILDMEEAESHLCWGYWGRKALITDLASALHRRFTINGDPEDLDRAIAWHREAHGLWERGKPPSVSEAARKELADCLDARMLNRVSYTGLDEVIKRWHAETSLDRLTRSDCDEAQMNLAILLVSRFDVTGNEADLTAAMEIYEALQHVDSPPEVAESGRNRTGGADEDPLSTAQFTQLSLESEASTWIGEFEVKICPPESKKPSNTVYSQKHLDPDSNATAYFNLAKQIFRECKAHCKISDLNRAVALLEEAEEHWPATHPARRSCLNWMAVTLSARFSHTGDTNDLWRAGKSAGQALLIEPHLAESQIPDDLTDYAGTLSQVSHSFSAFHEHMDLSALDRAVALHRDALSLREGTHPQRCQSLNELSRILLTRFRITSRSADLEEAILLQRQVNVIEKYREGWLATALLTGANFLTEWSQAIERFYVFERALSQHSEALELMHSGLNMWETASDNQDFANVDDIISTFEKAKAQLSWRYLGEEEMITDLRLARMQRFKMTGNSEDLNHVIECLREEGMISTEWDKPPWKSDSWQNLLAASLHDRFRNTGAKEDLKEALALCHKALLLQPPPHKIHRKAVSNLVRCVDKDTDLDEIFEICTRTLHLTPTTNPERGPYLLALADLFQHRFQRNGEQEDLFKTIELYEEAVPHLCIPRIPTS